MEEDGSSEVKLSRVGEGRGRGDEEESDLDSFLESSEGVEQFGFGERLIVNSTGKEESISENS